MFKSNSKYLIKTPLGFQHFFGVQKKIVKDLYEFKFLDGSSLNCSGNHALLTNDGFLTANVINKNKHNICGKEIVSITYQEGQFEVYDPVGVESETYFSNGLVSHNTEFLGSSNTLIDAKKLRLLKVIMPLSSVDDVKIFEQPKKDVMYCIVVDTGTGSGGDYSAFTVLEISSVPYTVVCTYRSKYISPYLYPNIIVEIAKRYNEAYILIETQVGSQVADILYWDLGYGNLVTTMTTKNGQVVGGQFGVGQKFGVHTSKQVKRIGCSNLKSLIESDRLIINDVDIKFELQRFVSNTKGSFEAEEGHDDLVMTLVLFSWLTQQQYFKELCDTDVRRHLANEYESMIESDVAPFGFINSANATDDFVEDVRIRVDDWFWSSYLDSSW